jgi:nitrite reductase (NO-forming)
LAQPCARISTTREDSDVSITRLATRGVMAIALLGVGWTTYLWLRDATESSQLRLDPVQGMGRTVPAVAPRVPPPTARNYATRVVLDLEIREHTKSLADGVTYTYWTFGENCPGPFVRIREGDLVETRLSNHPDNSVAHNISFQAATAPDGGGNVSLVEPGRSVTFTWRAVYPGLYLYKSTAPPAGLQVANGLYGLVLVEPRAGLPAVSREYQVVQGEFYTDGGYGERGPQSFGLDKAMRSEPEYVVFNGRVGSLVGADKLEARVGERVRIYVANAGPNLASSFHIRGVTFDTVYEGGSAVPTVRNTQNVAIAPGSTSVVEFTARVPGEYTLLDDSTFRASQRGALGLIEVQGRANDLLFTGKTKDESYNPGTHLERLLVDPSRLPGKALSVADLTTLGGQVYGAICFACHQSDGKGLAGKVPPLAQSDFLAADTDRAIRVLLKGLSGDVTVNGVKYSGEMPKLPLTTEQIAAALTYVKSSFGNRGDPVMPADVVRVRAADAAHPDALARATPGGAP